MPNIFTAAISPVTAVIGKMLGTEKALERTIESVTKGLDALVYTDEEKAQEGAAERSEARSMVVKWMEATQGQNLARRIIALIVTGTWVTQYIVAQFLGLVAVWADESEKFLEAAEIMQSGADSMGSPVMLILAFYFAAPHMGSIIQPIMANMQKDKNKDK